MSKILKIAISLLIINSFFLTTASALAISGEIRFHSNRFTQMEPEEASLINANTNLDGFLIVAENNDLTLFAQPESLAIKVRNETTGYIWSSTLDDMENYQLNETWRNFIHSAITIDFIIADETASRESLTSSDSRISFQIIENGFLADIEFGQSEIKMQLSVTLEDADVVVSVFDETIYEPEGVKLISMQLYPFFGATKKDDVPGYMFIPDGAGALIRFEESPYMSTPFRARFYGEDLGISSGMVTLLNDPHVLRIPVYGMVHGALQNAFLTIVEGGEHYAELVAHTAGLFTEFNWITPTFYYRQTYFQPTTRDINRGPTVLMLQEDRNHFDIVLRHRILSDAQADYVGMALSYQARLVETGVLDPTSQDGEDDAPMIRLEFFGAEKREGLLWNDVVVMTTINDIPNFMNRLQDQGLTEMMVVYRGWARGGLSNSFPNRSRFERRLGSRSDVIKVVDMLESAGIPIFFHTDYSKAHRGINSLFTRPRLAEQINSTSLPFLVPENALTQARSDINDFAQYGILNLAIETTTSYVYSTFNAGFTTTRSENVATVARLLEILNDGDITRMALYQPNADFWHQTSHFFDIPMSASMYLFATDTVPFLHIVLRGHINYYTPVSNFSANSRQELLRMIEFGAYPSFLLTKEPSHLLANTPSRNIFTSEFDLWESTVVDYYQLISETLGHVRGERIVEREVLAPGVIQVTYENQVQIIVNYTQADFNLSGIIVEAEGFVVIRGGGN